MNSSVLSSNLSHARPPAEDRDRRLLSLMPPRAGKLCRVRALPDEAVAPQIERPLEIALAEALVPLSQRVGLASHAALLFVCCPNSAPVTPGPHDEPTSLVVLRAHRRARRWLRSHPSARAATVANAPRADSHSLHASSERLRRLRQRPAQTTARRLPQPALAPANRAKRHSPTAGTE
jgi:hypothetical protein